MTGWLRRKNPGVPRAPRFTRALSGRRLWVQLVAIAVFPTIGLAWTTGRLASIRQSTARQASGTARRIERLQFLLRMQSALADEHIPKQTALAARKYGIDERFVSLLIGFNPDRRTLEARRAVDALLATSPDPVVPGIRAELVTARKKIDRPNATENTVQGAYDRFDVQIEDLIRVELAAIVEATPTIGEAVNVARSLRAVSTLLEASAAAGAQSIVLFEGLTDAVHGHEKLLHLAGLVAVEERALTRLRADATPTTSVALTHLTESKAFTRFHDAVTQTLAIDRQVEPGKIDFKTMALVFRDGFERSSLYSEFINVVTTDATKNARQAQRVAVKALQTSIFYAVALGLLSVGLALLFTRSISRPLRALARRAGVIVDGSVDLTHAPVRGPMEITLVDRALLEAATNMASIRNQADALARGDLDNALLQTPSQSALGRSLQVTFDRLSKSIRDREDLQAQLSYQATHDALTQLANRSNALASLDRSLARARRNDAQVALLFIDLDGFKKANDEYGHPFGDEVLRRSADRLLDTVRGGDEVARLGGDEFVVIMHSVADPASAVQLAHRLIAELSLPIEIDGKYTRIGASIGISLNFDPQHDASEMLRQADLAVYRAKDSGRGRCEVFDESLRIEMLQQAEIERCLAHAVRNNEFRLEYQPVIDVLSGTQQSVEALLRWDRPGELSTSPGVFIPIAESSLMIVEIGQWVLDRAARQLAEWTQHPTMGHIAVAVNVSGRQLMLPGVVDDVRHALRTHGVSPKRLILEITETTLLDDMPTAIAHLEQLRALGVRIAIDDFGTGYTSIRQLGRLPVDSLKIDRSFVEHLERPQERSIVELIIEVGHTLGLTIIAEGVETTAQLQILRDLHCDAVQGYLLGRPARAGAADVRLPIGVS